MTTAVVALDSELKRKSWMREGLVQAASKSFWSPFTGMTKDAPVFQKNNENASDGHTVVFDFDGNIRNRAIKGKNTAYGKGEQKRKFSDKLTVQRYRLVVDNGDAFDAVDIGDLSISQHQDSRAKLGDLFVRFKDQSIFDAAQGNLITNTNGTLDAPTHVIDLGATFGFAQLLEIEKTLRVGRGFDTGSDRRPLDPYMLVNGEPVWLFVIDAYMANLLRADTAGYQTIMKDGDWRGEKNRNISGVLGRLGRLLIIEAPNYFGETDGTSSTGWALDGMDVEMCGLRQLDAGNSAWTGQDGFDSASTTLHSRGLIFGKAGVQLGFGKMPDYKYQESTDFGIKSESAVEFWMESKKTKLIAENTDYADAKIAGMDHGVICVDVEVQ